MEIESGVVYMYTPFCLFQIGTISPVVWRIDSSQCIVRNESPTGNLSLAWVFTVVISNRYLDSLWNSSTEENGKLLWHIVGQIYLVLSREEALFLCSVFLLLLVRLTLQLLKTTSGFWVRKLVCPVSWLLQVTQPATRPEQLVGTFLQWCGVRLREKAF